MLILLFVYVICTVLIGLGFSGRVDYPYSKFTTIFGMPVLIWFMFRAGVPWDNVSLSSA